MGNSLTAAPANGGLEEALNLMEWALKLLDESGSDSYAAINLDLAINQLKDELTAKPQMALEAKARPQA